MGFPPGQRGSAEHAEHLVSVPWKPEREKIGLKAGRVIRTGMKSNSKCQGYDTSGGCWEGWKKGDRVCSLSLRAPPGDTSGIPDLRPFKRGPGLSPFGRERKKEMLMCCIERKGLAFCRTRQNEIRWKFQTGWLLAFQPWGRGFWGQQLSLGTAHHGLLACKCRRDLSIPFPQRRQTQQVVCLGEVVPTLMPANDFAACFLI